MSLREDGIMKRVLFTANSDRHILLCHLPYLKWFKDNGYEVHVVTNTDRAIPFVDVKHKISMNRNPFSLKNIWGIFELLKIYKNNEFDLIHTHTPVGSVLTRIAYCFYKKKSNLFYTCHGFHFYKGAPFYYWLLFFPIEKILMNFVDILFVMNKEDFDFSKKHFKKSSVRLINGVGFNKNRLDVKVSRREINQLYKDLNISKNDFVISYVAEYSVRKRQCDLIKHLAKTNIKESNIKVLLIGDDAINGRLQKLVKKYNLNDVIKFVDFVDDIAIYYYISNLVISCSRQEGLPLNIMEAIYMKKLLLVSDCRGNVDLVKDGTNGFIVHDFNDFYSKICFIKDNYKLLKKKYNVGINILDYSSDVVLNDVVEVYKKVL